MAEERQNEDAGAAIERQSEEASLGGNHTEPNAKVPAENPVWNESGAQEDDLERIAREMDTPAKKFARWNPKKRLWFERAAGFLVGALSGVALSLIPSDNEGFFSLNIVVPLLLVLVIPRIAENKLQTQLKELKKFMLIALGIYVAALAVIALTSAPTM